MGLGRGAVDIWRSAVRGTDALDGCGQCARQGAGGRGGAGGCAVAGGQDRYTGPQLVRGAVSERCSALGSAQLAGLGDWLFALSPAGQPDVTALSSATTMACLADGVCNAIENLYLHLQCRHRRKTRSGGMPEMPQDTGPNQQLA